MQDQDFSSLLVVITPNVDTLSYHPDRVLYWYGGVGKPPFCSKPDQPVNELMLSQAIRRSESHCKLFDMSSDEDRTLFQLIKNRVLQNWYRVAKEETHWDSDNKKMLIWLEWVQDYLFLPHMEDNNYAI